MSKIDVVKSSGDPKVDEVRANLREGISEYKNMFDLAIPTGGLGWGVFDAKQSDIDLWFVSNDIKQEGKLEWSLELHIKYLATIVSLNSEGKINGNSLRHPATYLDAKEFYWYRRMFPGFYGFPIESEVYVPLQGKLNKKTSFSEIELIKDVKYLTEYFYLNLEKLSYGCSDDLVKRKRRIRKRLVYFLRFWLLLKKNVYVIDPDEIFQELNRTGLKASDVYYSNEDIESLKRSINGLMGVALSQLHLDLTELDKTKAYLRRHYFKILMKSRWDYVLEVSGSKHMRPEISKRWIGSLDYIDEWVTLLVSVLKGEGWIQSEWREIARNYRKPNFYYGFTKFMDNLLPSLEALY